MDEAGEEDRIGPEAVTVAVDERELAGLEIEASQRLVSKTTAQDAITRESFGPEDERPSLPSEFAGIFPSAATARGPAEEPRHDYREDDTASSAQLGPPRG
jgi:hypothetical protein